MERSAKSIDIELVMKARAGDQRAFALLMEKYKGALSAMILKMVNNRDDMEDLVQITFSKAFNTISSYSENFAFSTWLFKIATNNCIDHLRKRKLPVTSIDKPMSNDDSEEREYTIAVEDNSPSPVENIIREQRLINTREAVKKLDEKYRVLIEMQYYDELPLAEIAERLELPVNTVKVHLFRAKKMLYDIMNPGKERY